MKNLFSSLMLCACMVFSSAAVSAQNPSEGNAIAKAKSQCGNDYHGPNAKWVANPIILGLCAQPSNNEYVVYEVRVNLTCPSANDPDGPVCTPAPPIVIAHVTYDCDGNVTVDCMN